MDVLWRSPNALPSDKYIVAWVKLSSISEEISTSFFSFDDPSNLVRLSEPRVQLRLKGFEKRLEGWKKQFDLDGMNGSYTLILYVFTILKFSDSLLLTYYYVNIFLHEIALHDEHPPENFTPPFAFDKITSVSIENSTTPPEIDAIAACISSSHSMLDILLNMDVETLRALPIFLYARAVYAVTVLTKLYLSIRSPQSRIRAILDKENLKVDFYLKSLIIRWNEAVGPMECRSPQTFLGLLLRLYSWFRNQESHDDSPHPTEHFVPNQSHLEETDLNKASEETGMTSQAESQTTPGDDSQFANFQMDADTDGFLLFGDMDSFGEEFDTWMLNIDMPGVLEGEPMADV
jgi:hypothetical protein